MVDILNGITLSSALRKEMYKPALGRRQYCIRCTPILPFLIQLFGIFFSASAKTWHSKTVCYNDNLEISCPEDGVLVFKNATYGRTSESVCATTTSPVPPDVCCDPKAFTTVSHHCFGNKTCFLHVSDDEFRNPCQSVNPYLDVIYTCDTVSSILSVCDGAPAVTVSGGAVINPGFPNFTSWKTTCSLDILIPHGMFINADLSLLRPKSSASCEAARLKLLDRESQTTHQYCFDQDADNSITSSYKNFTVTFTLTRDNIEAAFLLLYEVQGCQTKHISIPQNAHLEGLVYGEAVNIVCDIGYESPASGVSRTRHKCQEGHWTGEHITCEAVSCGVLPTIPNGQVQYNSMTYNSQATYTCIRGFKLQGDLNRTCLANGTWSGQEPECQRITCKHPGIPANGHATPSVITLYPLGTTISFSCEPNFTLIGETNLTCQANQSWSSSLPTCTVPTTSTVTDPSTMTMTPTTPTVTPAQTSPTTATDSTAAHTSPTSTTYTSSQQSDTPGEMSTNATSTDRPVTAGGRKDVDTSDNANTALYAGIGTGIAAVFLIGMFGVSLFLWRRRNKEPRMRREEGCQSTTSHTVPRAHGQRQSLDESDTDWFNDGYTVSYASGGIQTQARNTGAMTSRLGSRNCGGEPWIKKNENNNTYTGMENGSLKPMENGSYPRTINLDVGDEEVKTNPLYISSMASITSRDSEPGHLFLIVPGESTHI